MDTVPSDEELTCVFTRNGEDIEISNGCISRISGSPEKISFGYLSSDSFISISSDDVPHFINTALKCEKKRFLRFRRKAQLYQPDLNKENKSSHQTSQENMSIETRTPRKYLQESSPNRKVTDSYIENGAKRIKISLNKDDIRVLSNWFTKNKPANEILQFRFNRKYFMSVLYSFNPVVKLEKSESKLIEDSCNKSAKNYKNIFLNSLGLNEAQNDQNSDSETNIETSENMENVENQIPNSGKKSKFDFKPWINSKKTGKHENRVKIHHEISNTKIKLQPKANYVMEEDKFILSWVLMDENPSMVNGNTIWRDLERRKDLPYDRSWQSLRNRYLKHILCNLRSYGLSSEDEKRLKVGANLGTLKRRKYDQNYGLVIVNKKKKLNVIDENNGSKIGKILSENIIHKPKPLKKLSQSPSKYKLKNDDYEDSDILSDDTNSMTYKEFKTNLKVNKKRQLFTNKTFLQSSIKSNSSKNG